MRIVITSTDPQSHQNYLHWLRRLDEAIAVEFLLPGMDVDRTLATADGLLLPGGGDPDPLLYGKPELRPLCSVDAARDALEIAVIRHAMDRAATHAALPLLGICRGLQIMNVALGGTLIADLPTSGYDGHHFVDGDRTHDVRVLPDTPLEGLITESTHWTNSAHHQGIDIVAPRLAVWARALDGVIEALGWARPAGRPFLLLVHWHPERLPASHPLGDPVGRMFLSACAHNKKTA
ncbi:MAG: gamma-glutamyl-gamma-aminobutyrate hydrolase family protein [Bacteroidota bacterium]|jgi:putative glutamine amidotransferase|nr:gamma-glutamyl-gamma-aminobutyrate hydrolase family protein [Bacteroidota bacterium]